MADNTVDPTVDPRNQSSGLGGDTGGSDDGADNTVKDPDNWTTGDEAATGAQMSYLKTMASEADVDVPEELTKAEASKMIDKLQDKTDRG